MKRVIILIGCLAFLSSQRLLGQTILLPIGSGPFAVELNREATIAVVANRNRNSVSIINLVDNTISTTINVGAGPTSVAIHPTTNRAVVTNFLSDTVSVIDLDNVSVVATVGVGTPGVNNNPRDVAIDTNNNVAIITNLNSNSVSLVDLNTNTNILPTPIQVGASPISVAFSPDNNTALVANFNGNSVSVIDLPRRARIRDIPVGLKPYDIAVNLQTRRAVVANQDTNDVTVLNLNDVLDLSKNPVVANVGAGSRPFGIAINPRTNIAAVLSNDTRSISLINLNDNTRFTTVISNVGANPTSLAINPNNNTALVTNQTSDSVVITPLGFLNFLPLALDTEVFRSNLVITNLSATGANVEMALSDPDGNILATGSTTVPGRGLRQINNVNRSLLNASMVTNTTGALRIMSDQPISSFISVIDNATNDPALQLGRASGASKLLINSATNMSSFRSRLTILNLGNTTARVIVTARDNENGQVIGRKDDIFIPLNGFFNSDDILSDLGLSEKFGPLEIESPNLQPLMGVTLVRSNERTGGFLEAVPIQ